jgi:hypothetical protein
MKLVMDRVPFHSVGAVPGIKEEIRFRDLGDLHAESLRTREKSALPHVRGAKYCEASPAGAFHPVPAGV